MKYLYDSVLISYLIRMFFVSFHFFAETIKSTSSSSHCASQKKELKGRAGKTKPLGHKQRIIFFFVPCSAVINPPVPSRKPPTYTKGSSSLFSFSRWLHILFFSARTSLFYLVSLLVLRFGSSFRALCFFSISMMCLLPMR